MSIVWRGTYPSHPADPQLNWAYYNSTDRASYIYDGTSWHVLTRDGIDGSDGQQGTSISWQGTYPSHPADPQLNWAYYNSADRVSYIYDGTSWQVMAQDGTDGVDGTDGEPGASGTDGVSIVWQGTYTSHPTDPQVNWAYHNSVDGISYIYDGSTWSLLCRDGQTPTIGADIRVLFSGTEVSNGESFSVPYKIPAFNSSTEITFVIENAGIGIMSLIGSPVVGQQTWPVENPLTLDMLSDFHIQQPDGLVLGPGQSTDFRITFTPSDVYTTTESQYLQYGVEQCEIAIETNDPQDPIFSFYLYAQANDPPFPFFAYAWNGMSIDAGDSYTLQALINGNLDGDDLNFTWYVNNILQSGVSGSSFEFVRFPSEDTVYNVSLEVTDGFDVANATVNFVVKLPYVESKIFASDGRREDQFGKKVSISGDMQAILVSAQSLTATYLYEWNGSSWDETIFPVFGNSVAISDAKNRIAIGSIADDSKASNAGAVYIYEKNLQWSQTATIVGSDIPAYSTYKYSWFGSTVDFANNGDTLVVGAFYAPGNTATSGAVYVYRWVEPFWVESKIFPRDGTDTNNFGYQVDITDDGQRMVVSDYRHSVYICSWNGVDWDHVNMVPSDYESDSLLGYSVAISNSGSAIVVGAPQDESASGSAYLYQFGGESWLESKIKASDAVPNREFGQDVAISDNGSQIVIGAFQLPTFNITPAGSAYVYKLNGTQTWYETEIRASDEFAENYYGMSVNISANNTIVIGAPAYLEGQGAVYIYEQ